MKATFLQSADLLFLKSWGRQSQETLSLDLEGCRKSLYTSVCVRIFLYICAYSHTHIYIYMVIYTYVVINICS